MNNLLLHRLSKSEDSLLVPAPPPPGSGSDDAPEHLQPPFFIPNLLEIPSGSLKSIEIFSDSSELIPIPIPKIHRSNSLKRLSKLQFPPAPTNDSESDIQLNLGKGSGSISTSTRTGTTSRDRMIKRRSQSMDDIFGSKLKLNSFGKQGDLIIEKAMSDCVPSPSSGDDSSYASSTGSHSSSEEDGSSSSPSCEISLLERLIRTHPVWFLPSLQRSGALHLLQGRDVGNFIVRSSTQPKTMAVSVKLPGNIVEHYLLHAISPTKISLENSTHTFPNVHQLIAHYCTISGEVPVCLRVPSAIADATTRQQLRSLALLGQEFWTHPFSGSIKELNSPETEIQNRKFLRPTGLGSHSSSSQNSLTDCRKPCRPTTLEINSLSTSGGGHAATSTPPPIPPRWSRSALLTPLSLPSSIQSTPSEIQSTFSDKSAGRLSNKKKKRHSGGKAASIHYKDTEILDLFKGTKTSYDDKASDYEDIWSPQYSQKSSTPTLDQPPRLSTFKPDLIATSYGSDLDRICEQRERPLVLSSSGSQITIRNNNEHDDTNTNPATLKSSSNTIQKNNIKNSQTHQNSVPVISSSLTTNQISKSKSSLYSEPVDSLSFRRFANYRHSEPNIRWSQPAILSLVSEFSGGLPDIPGSPVHNNNEVTPTSLTDVSMSPVRESQSEQPAIVIDNQKPTTKPALVPKPKPKPKTSVPKNSNMSCASVDNLCHLRDIRKRSRNRWNCGGGGGEDDDDEGRSEEEATCPTKEKTERVQTIANNNKSINTNPLPTNRKEKPLPAPRKRSTDLANEKENQVQSIQVSNSTTPTAVTNPNAWHLDNSWEFVMWDGKQSESNEKSSIATKFPVLERIHSIPTDRNGNGDVEDDLLTKSQDELNLNNPNLSVHRFSRYDNLDSRDEDEENENKLCGPEDLVSDTERDEKISAPWDSSKWEHLLRIVSESTQQLDSIQMTPSPPIVEVKAPIQKNNQYSSSLSTILTESNESTKTGSLIKQNRESKLLMERQRISKILEVSGNVDRASKAISSVVRQLADKETDCFGPTLKSFISCTIAAKVQDPYKVMGNIRQFISGMKNYLVGTSTEASALKSEIKKQSELLSDYEFLNIDAILEGILVDLVISPLNMHIRGLLQIHYAKSDEPIQITEHCFLSSTTHNNKQEFYDKLKKIMIGFEDSVSPIKKLDKWNEFVCLVQDMDNYSSDSFLPLLAESLSSVCSSNIGSHVDYMIGLLPHSLAEQNNFSISLLQSALSALKSRRDRKGSSTLTSVRVIVPDERNGTLIRKMVPIRDTTTTKDVAKIVASKVGIANPGDYVLVRIKNGEEKLCADCELISPLVEDAGTALAYKRMDAKIGWPLKIT